MLRAFIPIVVFTPALLAAAEASPDFLRDIKPIFTKNCTMCHGPSMHQSEFRLDRKADAFHGGASGLPAIVPGSSEKSLLIRYVTGTDPKLVMPPGGKRLAATDIQLLKTWIDRGATWPDDAPRSPDSAKPDPKQHWSLQQPKVFPPPQLKNTAWVRNPIDAFILAKLEANGWKPNPAASPDQLMRRLYLNLTGLPPTLAEQAAFAAKPNLDALVESLLARPTYGERWARHWLDVVRYGESNGYERDAAKPYVWKYRDYVIRAFNEDKPFNQFTLEQLAGDELPNPSPTTQIATAYHALGPWDDEPSDPLTDQFDQLDDMVSTTSQVFLGLTLGCARCHNHKFEPLSTKDYYSMVSVFRGLERWRNGRTELAVPTGPKALAIAEHDRKVRRLDRFLEDSRRPYIRKPVPESIVLELEGMEDQMCQLEQRREDTERAYFLQELKPQPRATNIMIRGSASSPGPEVGPAVPDILTAKQPTFPQLKDSSGRRLALAQWLVSKENPLTARVTVNRIWQAHFGEGLVRTPNDFGVMGERPTHPELLDFLANYFVDNGWSVKKLHRLILQSNAYRMSRTVNEKYLAEDPENRLLWRMPMRRLEVEAIHDSVLAVSGSLNRKMYGPSVYPNVPKEALEGNSDPESIWRPFNEQEASRRGIYAFIKRAFVVPMFEVFDFCDTVRSAAKRLNTNVPTQALTLFNGDLINRQSVHFANRLRREAGPNQAKQIDLAFRLTLARPPTPKEKDQMQTFLKDQPLEQVARVIFNLNEFVYPD